MDLMLRVVGGSIADKVMLMLCLVDCTVFDFSNKLALG